MKTFLMCFLFISSLAYGADSWHMLAYPAPEEGCDKLAFEVHAVMLAGAGRLKGVTPRGHAILEFDTLDDAKSARDKADRCAIIGHRIWLAD